MDEILRAAIWAIVPPTSTYWLMHYMAETNWPCDIGDEKCVWGAGLFSITLILIVGVMTVRNLIWLLGAILTYRRGSSRR